MRCAEQAQVVERVGASLRPSLVMMNLEETSGVTTLSILADVAAAEAVAFDQLPPSLVGDAGPRAGGIGKPATGPRFGLSLL